jgi:hypothetical protein
LKVESMCKSSRSSGARPRNFTPSRSRSRSPYIGSPLNASYAEFCCLMLQFLCLKMCIYSGSAIPWGGASLGNCPPKHGCAVEFHFSESEQDVLPRVQGIQVAVPHNTVTSLCLCLYLSPSQQRGL